MRCLDGVRRLRVNRQLGEEPRGTREEGGGEGETAEKETEENLLQNRHP
eukprot:COSAG02_NODE_68353_length_250_cov_4.470199_1_plen_48_part_01